MYDLREMLTAFGCPSAQINSIVEKLASDTDVHIAVDLPPHRAARESPIR
jgi:hypothetical protein